MLVVQRRDDPQTDEEKCRTREEGKRRSEDEHNALVTDAGAAAALQLLFIALLYREYTGIDERTVYY